MATFISLFFVIFCFHKILCLKPYGDYYIENEGFKPPVVRTEPIAYSSYLVQGEYNKLICADYYFSRKVGPIGLLVTFKKYTDGASGQLKNSGINEIKIDNMCNTSMPMHPFRDKFSGNLDHECCVYPGNWTLRNWTFEEHMKHVVKDFMYDKYLAHLRYFEKKKGGGVNVILEHEIILIFKDNDTKKNAAKAREQVRKDKGNRGKMDMGPKKSYF